MPRKLSKRQRVIRAANNVAKMLPHDVQTGYFAQVMAWNQGYPVFAFPNVSWHNKKLPAVCPRCEQDSDTIEYIYIAMDENQLFEVWLREAEQCHRLLADYLSLKNAIKIAYQQHRALCQYLAPIRRIRYSKNVR